MPDRIVYFNGEFIPESEARVSIFDSALMFGDMAFEMTRTYNHKPFHLRDHLERLYSSLRLLETDCGLSIDEMEEITLETLERNLSTESDDVDWQIMHDVSRGPLPVYHSIFPNGLQPTVSINCWPLISHMGNFAKNYTSGVEVMIASQHALPAHLIDAKAKTRSRVHYQMAVLQGARMGHAWPVMLDPDGFIAEGPGWNIFFVRDGILYTSEPRNILLGVSRKVTLALARKLGIETRETNLGRYEALQSDEIFITGTTHALIHAIRFEGQQVGDGNAGPVYRRLLEAWMDYAEVDFVAQAESYGQQLSSWERREHEALSVTK